MYYLIFCENRVLRIAGFKTIDELQAYKDFIKPVQSIIMFGNVLQFFNFVILHIYMYIHKAARPAEKIKSM